MTKSANASVDEGSDDEDTTVVDNSLAANLSTKSSPSTKKEDA
jgi:hypothetical protein